MNTQSPLRVAALVDLPRSPQAGGHVKGWERLAKAAAASDLPLALTVYFSEEQPDEMLGPRTRLRHLPPVFSSKRLTFLPYMPDYTDLASYHPRLAEELTSYDVIHTTDGFFAYAGTAAKVAERHGLALVNSFHTDTPSYARIFTGQTIEKIFGQTWLSRQMIETLKLPDKQAAAMTRKLAHHLRHCHYAMTTRAEDAAFAATVLGKSRVRSMRLGTDKTMFHAGRANRADIEEKYKIPSQRIVVLFVGRVDIGKNIYTLVNAVEALVAAGVPLHLVTAGQGPAEQTVRERLPHHSSVLGFVAPQDLAELYASVDCLALCSEVETRSMATVEAIASGCPVLIAKKNNVADLFGATAALEVVTGGADAWAQALRRFAETPAIQKTMRDAAALYARTTLASWQDILREDFLPAWQTAAAAAQANKKRAAA